MSLSSVTVVTNALRLRGFKPSWGQKSGSLIAHSPAGLPMKEKIEQAKLEEPMQKIMKIEGMSCAHCKAAVEKALAALPEVSQAVVNLDGKEALITMQEDLPDETLFEAVREAGYEPIAIEIRREDGR
jgi:copper chaperone CopZ